MDTLTLLPLELLMYRPHFPCQTVSSSGCKNKCQKRPPNVICLGFSLKVDDYAQGWGAASL